MWAPGTLGRRVHLSSRRLLVVTPHLRAESYAPQRTDIATPAAMRRVALNDLITDYIPMARATCYGPTERRCIKVIRTHLGCAPNPSTFPSTVQALQVRLDAGEVLLTAPQAAGRGRAEGLLVFPGAAYVAGVGPSISASAPSTQPPHAGRRLGPDRPLFRRR